MRKNARLDEHIDACGITARLVELGIKVSVQNFRINAELPEELLHAG